MVICTRTDCVLAEFKTGLIFKLQFYRLRFYQISISYCPSTNLTYGLVLVRNLSNVAMPLLVELRSYHASVTPNTGTGTRSHPLRLLIIAIQTQILRTSRRIHSWDKDINGLEEVMGQHEYEDRPLGNPLEMDFTSATRKLNHISKRVGVDILNLGFLTRSLDIVEKWHSEILNKGERAFNGIKEVSCQEIKKEMALMKEECHSLLLLAEYEEKRMRILIQAVRFLIFLILRKSNLLS